MFISIKEEENNNDHDKIILSIPTEGISGAIKTSKANEIEPLLISAFNDNPKPNDIDVSVVATELSADASGSPGIGSDLPESDDPFVLLERLKSLFDKGIISDTEYQQKKSDLLKRI